MTAKLNAHEHDGWSVLASSEEEALDFINGLNNCLAHPELNTVEKIEEWIATQKAQSDKDEEQ